MAAIQQIIDILKNKSKFLITSHMDPDGDSIGSQLAVYNTLVNSGKEAVVVNQGNIPGKYSFLDPEKIIRFKMKKLPFIPDAVIVLECPTIDRTGFVEKLIPDNAFIINIDHHNDNINYGNINLVDAESSAVAELLYFIFKEGNFEITLEIAKEIYAAIVSDTGRFKFSSTSARAMRVSAELIELGVNPKAVSDSLYSSWTPQSARLMGSTLTSLKLAGGGRIGYLVITQADLENSGARLENSEGFVDFVLSVSGVSLGFLFKEMSDSRVKVSVRSQNSCNSAKFAAMFNGGGHLNAAGFSQQGNLRDIIGAVVKKAEKFIDAP